MMSRSAHTFPLKSKQIAGMAIGIAMLSVAVPALGQEGQGKDEVFGVTAVIEVVPSSGNTAGTFFSFDISWVDPVLNKYFLADRNNKSIDVIDPTNLKGGVTKFPQAFAGFTGNNDTSGPDGVLTANNHTELWVGDNGNKGAGPGQVWVLDATNPAALITKNPATGKLITNPIPIDNPVTKAPSTTRADELCYDSVDNLIMIASPAENGDEKNPKNSKPFVSFISTKGDNAYTVVGQLVFDGKAAPQASNGLEQCGWSPQTGKFYQNVPEISGAGDDTSPGGVAVIDPKSVLKGSPKVEQTFPVPIDDCAGPQGMAMGPHNQILLGCNAASPDGHRNIAIINQHSGAVIGVLPDLGGVDEVWFNENDFHYIIPSCDTPCRTPGTGAQEQLGIVDANGLRLDQSVTIATPNGDLTPFPPPPNPRTTHSAAAGLSPNLVFLPIPACSGSTSATCGGAPHFEKSLCDTSGPGIEVVGSPSTKIGCIAVLAAPPNNDRPRTAQERGMDDQQQ
jgi:hypothetical protein